MSSSPNRWTDQQVEQIVGNLLRIGVITAAALVFIGGIRYLAEHGSDRVEQRFHVFHGEPAALRSPVAIVKGALAFDDFSLIQLGLLVLIATPVARVVFSVYAFAREHDLAYVVITLIVLVILLYSLFMSELSGEGG
jgi:uncharacterized membrane protein